LAGRDADTPLGPSLAVLTPRCLVHTYGEPSEQFGRRLPPEKQPSICGDLGASEGLQMAALGAI